jgi:hypothetical protein
MCVRRHTPRGSLIESGEARLAVQIGPLVRVKNPHARGRSLPVPPLGSLRMTDVLPCFCPSSYRGCAVLPHMIYWGRGRQRCANSALVKS